MRALLSLATRVQHEPSGDASTPRTLGICPEQGGRVAKKGAPKAQQNLLRLTGQVSQVA